MSGMWVGIALATTAVVVGAVAVVWHGLKRNRAWRGPEATHLVRRERQWRDD